MKSLYERCTENSKVRSRGVFDVLGNRAHPKSPYTKRFGRQLTINLTPEYHDFLLATAKERGCAAADLVRTALCSVYFGGKK